MLTAVVDHLWQSLLFTALVGAMVATLRVHSAKLRLWLWGIAAAKWLLPFSWLHAFGRWCGFPVKHTADPVPDFLVAAYEAVTPWFAPAGAGYLPGSAAILALGGALAVTAFVFRFVFRALERELPLALDETDRLRVDPDDRPPSIGFLRAAALTAGALGITGCVFLAGGIEDQIWRRELMTENALALRTAPIEMVVAAPGMGQRLKVIADENGVVIRNANIRDLVALVYGINPYAVWADQMIDAYTGDRLDSWLTSPRYDVHVRARIRAPEYFDAYALRQPITRLLAEKHDLTINANSECQAPCGRYNLPLTEPPL